MLKTSDLYHPKDVGEAQARWGANGGPCALAAVLQKPLWQMRAVLDGFEARQYMHPLHLRHALERAGARYTRIPATVVPAYGLWFVQFTGPWTRPDALANLAYRHTHTVGAALTHDEGPMLYDLSARIAGEPQGGWVPQRWWEQEIVPVLTARIPGADGGYNVRWACEVLVAGAAAQHHA